MKSVIVYAALGADTCSCRNRWKDVVPGNGPDLKPDLFLAPGLVWTHNQDHRSNVNKRISPRSAASLEISTSTRLCGKKKKRELHNKHMGKRPYRAGHAHRTNPLPAEPPIGWREGVSWTVTSQPHEEQDVLVEKRGINSHRGGLFQRSVRVKVAWSAVEPGRDSR